MPETNQWKRIPPTSPFQPLATSRELRNTKSETETETETGANHDARCTTTTPFTSSVHLKHQAPGTGGVAMDQLINIYVRNDVNQLSLSLSVCSSLSPPLRFTSLFLFPLLSLPLTLPYSSPATSQSTSAPMDSIGTQAALIRLQLYPHYLCHRRRKPTQWPHRHARQDKVPGHVNLYPGRRD